MKLNYITILLIVLLVSLLGSFLTSGDMAWYKTLKLPAIAPPGYVIGIVWTIIFILGAISAIIVWNKLEHNQTFWLIIGLFIVNAVLNVLWSYLFFNQHQIGWSIVEMIVLELSVLGLIVLIWPLARLGAILLLPYAIWVAFATYLAANIWNLNK